MSKEKDKKESALKVNDGIDEPSQINPDVVKKFLSQKKTFSVEEIIEGIKKGDRVALSRAITLIESLNPHIMSLLKR
jgi:LAO/AO transport system kinase